MLKLFDLYTVRIYRSVSDSPVSKLAEQMNKSMYKRNEICVRYIKLYQPRWIEIDLMVLLEKHISDNTRNKNKRNKAGPKFLH